MSRCLFALPFLLASSLSAQGADDATVPMRAERYHRLLFENSRVAVYDVLFPVGATMRFHEHPTDHLAIVIAPGALRNEVRGASSAQVRPPGPAGELVFLPAGPPHRQVNVGETPVHFIAAEILSHAGGARPAAPPPAGGPCVVVLDNEAVRALRCKLPPGQAAQVARATPFLRVVVTGDRVEWRAAGAAKQVVALVPGGAAWHEAAETGMLANVGGQPFEALDIEWK
jgi:quercetin dioxygenase-like cupin family protein